MLMSLTLLFVGVALLFVGLKLVGLLYKASRVNFTSTYSQDTKHLYASGPSRTHGMYKSSEGKIVPDSRLSNTFLKSLL